MVDKNRGRNTCQDVEWKDKYFFCKKRNTVLDGQPQSITFLFYFRECKLEMYLVRVFPKAVEESVEGMKIGYNEQPPGKVCV